MMRIYGTICCDPTTLSLSFLQLPHHAIDASVFIDLIFFRQTNASFRVMLQQQNIEGKKLIFTLRLVQLIHVIFHFDCCRSIIF